MALFIGAFLPDRKLDETPFCRALTNVSMGLAQYRQHSVQTSNPNLDLYFLMSGKEEQPKFEGMRFHSYDAKSNTLKIESSVPSKMIQSMHARNYVVAMMLDAVDGASEFFAEKKIEFERDLYHGLIETLGIGHGASIH